MTATAKGVQLAAPWIVVDSGGRLSEVRSRFSSVTPWQLALAAAQQNQGNSEDATLIGQLRDERDEAQEELMLLREEMVRETTDLLTD